MFYFGQKDPIKVPILTFPSALMKICQISHVIFQATIQFFYKFCMTLYCHKRLLLRTFLGQTLYSLHERDQSKCKLWVIGSKFTKLLSLLKQQICFPSNFLSLLKIMTQNSSVLFLLKFYIPSTKGAYQSTNFVKFHLSSRKSKILHFDGLLL